MSADKTDLLRFVEAQEKVWPTVVSELTLGKKASHWMWFIFPQLRELGRSGTAHFYGIEDLEEAKAYLAHPVLGPRLTEAMALMLSHPDVSAEAVLGPIDAKKLRSSATLFALASQNAAPFAQVLDVFYDGVRCDLTTSLLSEA
ncbi:DUF1810 domain-containing protein [Pseudovibrio exalbescens]|uniref:DUF1810 domain-containing protein n=1 Tax=Pseudovibrio exalbescens TaxID=197461 RepID=UPI0023665651|nr:DUF1810 domain-containing protein [Pseudovibrio exalbescens]MDD7911148.1 DUF1810 domain-containing protein [Pseudovibrio exalbescens]